MTVDRDIEAAVQETAERLLREKKVSVFLGYEKASASFRTAPLFLTSPDEARRLVWNPFCGANLTVYLRRLFARPADPRKARDTEQPTVGIVVRGCDARSVVTLIQEGQVARDRLVLVGVACPGVMDPRKAEKALGEYGVLESGEDAEQNVRIVAQNGTKLVLPHRELIAAACLECRSPVPPMYDVLIGPPPPAPDPQAERRTTAEFASAPAAARWELLQKELSKCIRCNACRQACPMCYCAECLLDQTRPRWLGAGSDLSDITIYHLVRAFHLAGRCSGCGACERACPMGIDTRLLIRKMNEEVEALYGYRPGESAEAAPPLASFAMDDPQDFILEP